MNGEIFRHLTKLTLVSLWGNDCIDESFETKEKLEQISEVVSAKCRFREITELMDNQKLRIKIDELFLQVSKLELQLKDVMSRKCDDYSLLNDSGMKINYEFSKIDDIKRDLRDKKLWVPN